MKKMGDTWREQQFEIFKYSKDGQDRGWVLKSTEQVVLLLEDMALNLQSMTNSRYVRAFLDDVNFWEKKLSLMGEVIEMWMQVWIYPSFLWFIS